MFLMDINFQIAREKLLNMLKEKAFFQNKEPVFTLSSGKQSPYYIDCKNVTYNASAMELVGTLFYQAVCKLPICAIGGLTLGADPIAYATAFLSNRMDKPLNAFVVRKESKTHGIKKWIEGGVKAGDRVAIVEDVLTTGKSTIKAIKRSQSDGLHVIKVIALVDREEGGKENIEKEGLEVESIFTLRDFL